MSVTPPIMYYTKIISKLFITTQKVLALSLSKHLGHLHMESIRISVSLSQKYNKNVYVLKTKSVLLNI